MMFRALIVSSMVAELLALSLGATKMKIVPDESTRRLFKQWYTNAVKEIHPEEIIGTIESKLGVKTPLEKESQNIDDTNTDFGPSEKPAFCNDLDCPSFKVIKKFDGYEERLYKKSGWVSTSLSGVDLDEATRSMFYKLFDYIQGKNAKKEKIAMTAPVITSIIPGPGPACENNFTMSFYMVGQSPPQPTESTVSLTTLPMQKVFVKSFGGFAHKEKWLKNAEALAEALVRDNQKFNSKYFYSAGYDSPFRILNRHNEVWYLAKM